MVNTRKLNERKSVTMLNSGINKIKSNQSTVICYRALKVPVGSKLYVIKIDEVLLDNPLLHIEVNKETNKYTTDRRKCILTCNNNLQYDYLIQSENEYYTIDYTMKYNENTLFHYGLNQIEYGSALILDSVDDIDKTKIFDITSIAYLIDIFTKSQLNIYPKSLLVINKDILTKPGLFIQVLDSKTIQQGFSINGIQRIDKIRLFFNNYSRKEVMNTLQTMNNMIMDNQLNICSYDNMFQLKELSNDNLVNDLTFYTDFSINYILTDQFEIDVVRYIKSVILNLYEIDLDKKSTIKVNKS